MLTNYIKVRLSRPHLTVAEDGKIPIVTKLPALQKLAYLKPGELNFDESDSDDDNDKSDTIVPFAEYDNEFDKIMTKAKKKLTRMEQNVKLMANFGEDFKKAMEETRNELQLESKLHYKDMDQIKETLKQSGPLADLSKSFEEKLNEIFRDEEYLNCAPDLDIPELNNETNEHVKSEFNAMSGVWKMLATTSDELIASAPGYNAHIQTTPHWLDREEIPWHVREKSEQKCKKWLDEKQKQ